MRDTDRSAVAPPFAIRRLWPADRSRILDHLLRLDPEDRALRFCHATGDAFISSYCDRIDWLGATMLGVFVDGELRGVAELIRIRNVWPPTAELALSVEGPYQDHGIGSALLRHALVRARNRLIGTVYMICLPENRQMQHIARKHAATLVVREGQVEGEILAPWPSYLSLLEEVATEGQALFGAAVEVPPTTIPQILDKTG
jgi:GNAT superfamily N-acetyltransferase